MLKHVLRFISMTLGALFLFTPKAAAQYTRSVSGVVTSSDGGPIPGVTVSALGTYWTTTTSAPDGAFSLDLPRGRWRLRFSRIGYRSDTVSIKVDTADVELPPVRLALWPTEVRALEVEGPRSPAFSRTVTMETVRQAPPLAEPDVFRTVVLLPGVTQPNDLSGRIHLAGGRSDQTGVRLDGHPLQDPFHLLGLLGAFNVAALEQANVLIHHLPSVYGGALSGLVDLHSREPGADSEYEVVTSLLSSSITATEPYGPAGLDVLASARATYADRVLPLFVSDVPKLGYYDGLFRIGKSWGDGWRGELLGYTTQNLFRGGEVSGIEPRESLQWGERLAGLRLVRESAGWTMGLRGSFDRARTHLDERPGGTDRIDITRDWSEGSFWLERRTDAWAGRLGVDIDRRRHVQFWDAPEQAGELLSQSVPFRFSSSEEQTTLGLYGQLEVPLADQLTTSTGVRLCHVADRWLPAPRMLVSYGPTARLRFHASAGRRFQTATEIEEPAEGRVTPPVFLLDDPRRVDVLAFGADWEPRVLPMGEEGRIRIEAFLKDYDREPVLPHLDPLFGAADRGDFPGFERVDARALGLTARFLLQLGNNGVLQGGYSFERAQERTDEGWINADWDTPHNLSLFASLPLGSGWTANTAFRLHSGPVATPIDAVTYGANRQNATGTLGPPRIVFGKRNGERLTPYHRWDVGLRHHWGEDTRWTLFFQVLNVTASDNALEPSVRHVLFPERFPDPSEHSGLPVLPSVGFEVRW